MDLILYHNNCPDGWCAAYVCKRRYPEAKFLPLNHGLNETQLNEVFEKVFHKDVIMVDYSLRTRELNDQMANVTKSFRILDHHKTAQAALDGASYATFDMKRSGAGLAWDYLFGRDSGWGYSERMESRPWWVDYTEDQDLWNWKLKDSQIINAWLMVQPRTIETWDAIAAHKFSAAEAEKLGRGVRDYIEYYTRSVVAEAQSSTWLPPVGSTIYKTAVLNIPYAGVSEAGNALCKAGYPIALLWFERGDGVVQFSLRGDGSVDVSAIAKAYGGGGHNNAAGFQLPLDEARALVDGVLGRTVPVYQSSRCVK